MSPFDLFNPATLQNATQLTGASGANTLLQAAEHFPGGPTMLVFALFWSPVGPGIPAGVLLARHVPLHPVVTFLLYTASDVLGAAVCHPVFSLLRRAARRVPALRWLGERMLRFAMLGTRMSRPQAVQPGAAMAPALFRVATVGFGVDVYTAGVLVNGLCVPRILGWASAIAGDLVWFALLLGTSLAGGGGRRRRSGHRRRGAGRDAGDPARRAAHLSGAPRRCRMEGVAACLVTRIRSIYRPRRPRPQSMRRSMRWQPSTS